LESPKIALAFMDTKKIFQNPKRRKKLIWFSATLFVYTVFGFFILPAIIKSQMLKRLPAITKRSVAIEKVKFNPYALSLTIRGLKLTETNNETFASVGQFYANVEPLSSLFHWAIVFKEISVTNHFAQITLQPDGKFNFANLLSDSPAPPPPPGPKKSLPRVIIGKLNIDNGDISFSDFTRKTPFHTKFAPMDIHLTKFTTKPDTDNPYSFTARSDSGEEFSWSGDVTVEPVKSHGSFKLTGIDLKKYSPYLADFARIKVIDGKLNVSADYAAAVKTNGLDATVSKMEVHLGNFVLNDGDEKVVSIPSFDIHQTEANLAKKTIHVGAVKTSDGSILARQNQDGTINLLAALTPENPAPISTTTNTATVSTNAIATASPWTIKVDEVAVNNWAIKVEDKKFAKDGVVSLDQLALSLHEIVLPGSAPMKISFSTRVNETGTASLSGSAVLSPLSADLKLSLTNLDLKPFQPYVDEHLKLAITDGNANSEGEIHFVAANTNSPMLKFKGGVEVKQFASADQNEGNDFLKFDSFKISGADVELLPNKFLVDEIKLAGLKTSIVVSSNQQINLLAILPQKSVGNTNVTVAANIVIQTNVPMSAPLDFPVELNAFVLENASFHYSDHAILPRCNFDVQEFGGTIKGLTSKNEKPADVDIRGKIDERSTFSVSGKLHPLATNLLVDLAIATKTTGLTAFTPYMEKFAGYPLNKGNLSVTLHYDVQGKTLKAENKIEIDQFTLGPKNTSPDATKLPVKLAVALLKDRNGKIELDVPLSGSLDDPKFKVGPLVWKVVMNILAKAATSPFALLGAAFGGGEEMSFVQFAPGSAEISETEALKLDKLSQALYDRPALSLEILGSADSVKDKVGLAQFKVEEEIKTLRSKELRGRNAITNLAEIKLEPADRDRLIEALFKQVSKSKEGFAVAAAVQMAETNSVTTNETAEVKKISLVQTPLKVAPPTAARGAEFLSRRETSVSKNSPAAVVEETPATKPVLKTSGKVTVAEMEQLLVDNTEISDLDLRELMQTRAQKVQSLLLKTGKITADRLFLLTPKPAAETTKGESRVNLSLN
jgi:hypothetical protein